MVPRSTSPWLCLVLQARTSQQSFRRPQLEEPSLRDRQRAKEGELSCVLTTATAQVEGDKHKVGSLKNDSSSEHLR